MFPRALVFTILLLAALPAHASFQLIKINEVFPGACTNSNAQFVELKMYANNENLIAGNALIVYDVEGIETGRFTFNSDPTHGFDQGSILIATAEAESFFSTSADLVMDPILPMAGGKVCFENIDCVSWGDYIGTSDATGTPFNSATGLQLSRSIERDISAGDETILEGSDDTNESQEDFSFSMPSPTNNTSVRPMFPPSTCSNEIIEGLECCDDGDTTNDSNGCDVDCHRDDICGDGEIQSLFEECDDGNTQAGDGCSSTCIEETGTGSGETGSGETGSGETGSGETGSEETGSEETESPLDDSLDDTSEEGGFCGATRGVSSPLLALLALMLLLQQRRRMASA